MAVLTLLSLPLLGAECGTGGTPPPPPASDNLVWIVLPPSTLPVGMESELIVSAFTESTPIQSWEFAFSVDPSKLEIVDVTGHFHFEDTTLAMDPIFDASAGRASRIVDFQHGTASKTGEIRIASITVRALAPGDSPLQIELRGLADSAGEPIHANVLQSNVTVVP